MSASKTFKFAGSTIAVLTGFDAESPSKSISGATQANPCVLTVTGHDCDDGDVIQVTGVLGMTEINDGVYIVEASGPNSLILLGVDSTDYGAYVSGGKADKARFSNFCELTGYNRQGQAKPEIDASSLCSNAAEFELGLPDFGTTQLDFKFAPQTAIQLAIKEFDASGDKMAVRVDLPKNGGRMVQLGFVQQTSESASTNGIWTGSFTIRNTGAREDFAAA
jgi:hypothetical protein